MIILDADEQESKLRDPFSGGPTLRFPEKAASRSDSPLPDYETSEARQKLIAKEFSAKSRRIEPRLWRAILYALGIYVFLTLIIGVPIIVVKKHHSHNPPQNYGDNDDPDYGNSMSANSSIWKFAEYAKCEWDRFELLESPPFSIHAEHNLTYSGSFYIQSNISDVASSNTYSIRNLTVDLNPDSNASDVLFTVDVQASSDDLFRHTVACFINSGNNRGLLINVTRPLQPVDFVAVKIAILLPQNMSSTVLDNFITDLPWFSQTFGDLTNHTINNIVLSGSHHNVTAESLKGSTISVKNSYASIVGDFYATSSLTLDGIKGNINANITLEQLDSSKKPTSLVLDTGHGSIDANVTLVGPFKGRPRSSPFSFTADVQTYNGPVTFRADYTNSTPPLPLRLTVTNTDGKTDVSLGKKYEGNFSIQSKWGDVSVHKPNHVSTALDPFGKQRQYTYQFQSPSEQFKAGWVGWGKPPKPDANVSQGQVKVTTSLSPITLHLAAS